MPPWIPPQAVADNAAAGLDLRKKVKAGTAVGIARARDLKNRRPTSLKTIGRMVRFFARHGAQTPADPGTRSNPTPWLVAWLLWGGDAGRAWANRIWAKYGPDSQEERTMGAKMITEGMLPMLDGESLGAFCDALVDAIRKSYEGRADDVYLREVFDDRVVVKVYLVDDGPGLLVLHTFSRAAGGAFTFGDGVEVRPVLTYVPVDSETTEAQGIQINGDRAAAAERVQGVAVSESDLASLRCAAEKGSHTEAEIATMQRLVDSADRTHPAFDATYLAVENAARRRVALVGLRG